MNRLLAGAIALVLLAVQAAAAATNTEAPASEKKTLRYAFRTAETGFDPMKVYDRYSVGILEDIFDSLLTYDWLARPVKLVPQVVEAVPEPEENGTRYTFRLRRGIYFADDPAFNGQRRELVAKDIEYGIRRFRDPTNRSPYEWLFENKIVGLDELAEKARKSGTLDYDTPVEGLKILDKYTIQFRLKSPDYNFLYFMAMPNVVPVAREVIEMYKDDTMGHPVGTGAYLLKEWTRRSKIVLERNPGYRGHVLSTEFADPNDPWDRAAIKALGGKKLPLIDRVEIYPIEQEQPRYLAFVNLEHDLLEETPFEFIEQILPNGKLAPNMIKRGASVFREEQLEVTYDLFNMNDPLIGGFAPEKIALRRALVLAHDRAQEIDIIRRKQAIPAQSLTPPGVVGYDPAFQSGNFLDYNLPKAKALLDMYGYIDRDGDGIRETPAGKPLILTYKYNSGSQDQRQLAELWAKSLADVGIKVETAEAQFADLLKDKRVGKYQMASAAWVADYPDAQNFLQLFYGPNIDQSNDARFKLPEYDRLYDKAMTLPDSPARNQLYREMSRVLLSYAPSRLGVHRIFNHFLYPWVKGYKKHPILFTSFKYLDVDVAAQKAATQ
ncbi:MAG: ABC transporter substrate-binding protein [Betaproteobacteria bacterium]